MKSPYAADVEPLDNGASRSIRDAVGEHLQKILRLEPAGMSPHLQHLVDELRRRDEAKSR